MLTLGDILPGHHGEEAEIHAEIKDADDDDRDQDRPGDGPLWMAHFFTHIADLVIAQKVVHGDGKSSAHSEPETEIAPTGCPYGVCKLAGCGADQSGIGLNGTAGDHQAHGDKHPSPKDDHQLTCGFDISPGQSQNADHDTDRHQVMHFDGPGPDCQDRIQPGYQIAQIKCKAEST